MLESPIARGTLGTLWRARDALGRVVAAKRIPVFGDAELIGLLGTDGARLAALDPDPGSADVVAWTVVVDELCVLLVMDLVAGGSWADRRSGGSGRDSGEVTTTGASIASCLARLHAAGLVHGDLKASAVLFDSPPAAAARVRLGDAGLAARFAASDRFGPRVLATAGRLDPAVAAGRPFGPPSDVFALGLLCAEMLLGGVPTSSIGTRPSHHPAGALARRLTRLRGMVPPGLEAAIRSALDPSPASRPTAAELATAFAEARGGPSPAPVRLAVPGVPWPATGPIPGAEEPALAPAPGDPVGASSASAPTLDPPGPRPLRPTRTVMEPDASRRRRRATRPDRRNGRVRRVASWCAVVIVAVLLAEGLWRAVVGPDSTVRRASGSPVAGCPTAGRAGTPAGASPIGQAALSGKGCLSSVVQVGQELEVRSASGERVGLVRFRPALPGGQVVIGDFACRGPETPALYDPRTGDVFVYARWPEPGRPVSATRTVRTGVTGGRLVVRHRKGTRCSSVQVLSRTDHTGTARRAAADRG